jgi:hypothetical protein
VAGLQGKFFQKNFFDCFCVNATDKQIQQAKSCSKHALKSITLKAASQNLS